MNYRLFVTTAAIAIASLTGCSGSQPPIGVSWGPQNAVVRKDLTLLYVTEQVNGDVYMVALPSGKLVGKLTGFDYATGDCVDALGDVFVSSFYAGQVRAYAHGAKVAFRVLSDGPSYPYGCSVDPTTGNLAVSNWPIDSSEGGVTVYYKAKGKAHHYYYGYAGGPDFWYCAYDSDGDLYAETTDGNQPIFLELAKGGDKLRPVSLHPAIIGDGVPPPLSWDGKYLVIAKPAAGAIYQYRMSGGTGTRVGVVKLDKASGVFGPFWIASNGTTRTLYVPITEDSVESVGVYRYPSVGKRLQNLYDVPLPFAAAVSRPK